METNQKLLYFLLYLRTGVLEHNINTKFLKIYIFGYFLVLNRLQ